MAAAFEKSPAGQRRNQELQMPYDRAMNSENALVRYLVPRTSPNCVEAFG